MHFRNKRKLALYGNKYGKNYKPAEIKPWKNSYLWNCIYNCIYNLLHNKMEFSIPGEKWVT